MKSNHLFSKRAGIIPFMLMLFLNSFAHTIERDWFGKADIDGIVLRLSIHIKANGQDYTSTWDSPDLEAFGIPSTTTIFHYPDFSFTPAWAGFKYSGQVTEVKYEIPHAAHTFKKGHRIMIQVKNSWFPLVDRNPKKFVNIYECSDSDFQKATQRIYHDSKFPSGVKVRILK